INFLRTYVIFCVAACCFRLAPELKIQHLPDESFFYIDIDRQGVVWTFVEANILTMLAMLGLLLPPVFTKRHCKNVQWIFVMPFYVHCIWGYRTTVNSMTYLSTTKEAFAMENYYIVQVITTGIFTTQLLILIELAACLFCRLKRNPRPHGF
ncbi:hypothetical protein KR018_000541, partial [Drosophila ironensis]